MTNPDRYERTLMLAWYTFLNMLKSADQLWVSRLYLSHCPGLSSSNAQKPITLSRRSSAAPVLKRKYLSMCSTQWQQFNGLWCKAGFIKEKKPNDSKKLEDRVAMLKVQSRKIVAVSCSWIKTQIILIRRILPWRGKSWHLTNPDQQWMVIATKKGQTAEYAN